MTPTTLPRSVSHSRLHPYLQAEAAFDCLAEKRRREPWRFTLHIVWPFVDERRNQIHVDDYYGRC